MTLAEVLPEGASQEHTDAASTPRCPGLNPTAVWDEAPSLRGEMHSVERLTEHAAEVARAHGRPSMRVTPGPLRARFAAARSHIRDAYDALSREFREARREPLPAEEWLLENSHVVEDQLREVQEDLPWGYLVELPKIAHGAMRGYPRVYGLCVDYLRHTDAHVDMETLSRYVLAYQGVDALTIGELWAVPIMLRMGLVLTVDALASPNADARDRARGDAWAQELARQETPARVAARLEGLARDDGPVTAPLLVQLLRHVREQDTQLGPAMEWIRARCAAMGTTPVELTRRQHLRQAADQVSVGNAISSMRTVNALDWNDFFEQTSRAEAVLRRDPAGCYPRMDDATRDRYRHAVEDLARRGAADEPTVAREALQRAEEVARGDVGDVRAHIGYWLIDDGRAAIESAVGYRPRLLERLRRAVLAHATVVYLGGVALVTAGACAAAAAAGRAVLSTPVLAAMTALVVLPASEMAVSLVQAALIAALPPKLLPKLAFKDAVPETHRTLVAVPALLDSDETVERLVRDLEIRALANLDANLHFALVTDFTDADAETAATDADRLALARQRIDALNERHGAPGAHRFMLLHRRRLWNASQGRWMGWERKRGKLEELNRLLRGATDTSFVDVAAPPSLLAAVKYVITLDADTELPREVARRLVATMAHPLNRPHLDASHRVVRGHAILQPRVGTLPMSARRSRFARVAAGPSGIDPYTTAVSDLYQDLFGEGSFVGKGIYDVDAFVASMRDRVPDNRLLSHDLFEGIFARSALVSDIEVFDEQPTSYGVAAGRAHRWVRGDWQLLPWLFGRVPGNPLRALDRWKIVDNLRRSVLPIALVLLCFGGWLSHTTAAAWVTALLGVMFTLPVLVRLTLTAARSATAKTPSFVDSLGGHLTQNVAQSLVSAVFLLDQAMVNADAIVRTLYRLAVSRRDLLEWTTMSQAERRHARGAARRLTWAGFGVSVAGIIAVALRAPASLPFAAPVLLLWASSPWVAAWLARPPAARDEVRPLTLAEQHELRAVARRTWRFFETFVTAEEHHLPPDNYQEDPRGVVAHRTSPTNIGLYLLSVVAARDFGYVSLREVRRRLEATLDTIERLERREGHVLNWYDTRTLQPLLPQYVSTVDSGNLAAYLWTLRHACEELASGPLVTAAAARGAEDALRLAGEGALADRAAALAAAMPDDTASRVRELVALRDAIGASSREARAGDEALSMWRQCAIATLEGAHDDLRLLDHEGGDLPLREALRALGLRAGALADAMSFRFLFDEDRELFSIGYNVGNARLDGSHYDLLASEARLASLVAIARGDVPQEHWFRLGRPLAATTGGKRVLLSWSGSMFEYLMPLLVTRDLPDTILDETYDAMLARQREYGAERKVPWGISESAYNLMDLSLTYQYRAFGVPGLGLKAGLGEDLVVAPYATSLGAMVRADLAVQNLRELTREGAAGTFGFYEAIDYTDGHLPPGRRSVIVKTFMAHHQGMTLVALDNVLHDAPMQRRFHAEPRIMATELLLEERRPVRAPMVSLRATTMPALVVGEAELDATEHVDLMDDGPPRVHLLGHGELSTLITSRGDGFITWKGFDVHRYREDASLPGGGVYVYVRDLERAELWSAGMGPVAKRPDAAHAAFSIDHAELQRRDGDVETVTTLVVSPEQPADLRRITLTNQGAAPRTLEITTYTEVVLAPRSADVSHPAFGNLFIEVEVLASRGAMLARRRPRGANEAEVWLMQMLLPETGAWGEFTCEGSRARFLGRGRDVSAPAAMDPSATLTGASGSVLDPALALRRSVTIPAAGQARATLVTALASSRAEAMALVETYATPHSVARTFELAWADARVELKHLAIGASQAHRFQRLLSATLHPQRALRCETPWRLRARGRDALWTHGISGDLPMVIVRLDDPDFHELLREVLLAHEYFRLNGVGVDLVVLNEEPGGYLQPQQEGALSVIRTSPAERQLDQRAGVFVRRLQDFSDDDRHVLLGFARVVLSSSKGSLAKQLRALTDARPATPAPFAAQGTAAPKSPAAPLRPPPLRFDNGLGGFSEDGREYVLSLGPDARTPAPWSNVIANARFGTLVTESGGGFTWAENSQRHRLTPWSNDPVTDPVGEALYLRDDATGDTWSATPMPAGGDAKYLVRHGQGYTRFEHARAGLVQSLTVSVAPDDPVKLFRLTIENRTDTRRQLSLFALVEWALGASRETSRVTVRTHWEADLSTLVATNPLSVFPDRHAFLTTSAAVRGVTGDRGEFFGAAGSRARPAALGRASLSGRVGAGYDPCGALHAVIDVGARAQVEVTLALGEAATHDEALALAKRYRLAATVTRAEEASRVAFRAVLDRVVVSTPDPALDAMVNHWLLYQVLSCRFWGRSGFYQSGGAFGYRDQLQDVLALLHARPDLAREHILRAAARQFEEGDVQHWWHPESGHGVRTRCSDDMLWLPYVTAEYVRVTGDAAVLDATAPFLHERALGPNDEDLFSAPQDAPTPATLYEHCARALDAGTTRGAHDLPLMRGGDWNDGMNRIGHLGQGESVWLAWFLGATARDFGALAKSRGDLVRAARCDALVDRLAAAVDAAAWDGAWYRRAYFDDGSPVGSHVNVECRIDAIAQSWAVLAGFGDPARAREAVDASERELVRPELGLMRLLWPPFAQHGPDPGYIRAYPAGIRENGGQYTHGVLWTVRALARLGEGDRAAKLLSLLNPVHHGDTRVNTERYALEPYVLAGDVYDAADHEGRGGWSWYTGAAAWMYRIALEDILGIAQRGDALVVAPCIPRAWRGFDVVWRHGRSELHLRVENPLGLERGAVSLRVDGVDVAGDRIALVDDGARHEAVATLHADAVTDAARATG